MIITKCDRCGKERHFSTPVQRGFIGALHIVSPGNSMDNDRILCDGCYGEYERIKKASEISAAEKLLQWIDQ